MDKDLGKLGTVLAINNEIVKDTLNMLREQQKRQVIIIWFGIALVAIAVGLCCVKDYMIMQSIDNISSQIQSQNRVMEMVINARESNRDEATSE